MSKERSPGGRYYDRPLGGQRILAGAESVRAARASRAPEGAERSGGGDPSHVSSPGEGKGMSIALGGVQTTPSSD